MPINKPRFGKPRTDRQRADATIYRLGRFHKGVAYLDTLQKFLATTNNLLMYEVKIGKERIRADRLKERYDNDNPSTTSGS